MVVVSRIGKTDQGHRMAIATIERWRNSHFAHGGGFNAWSFYLEGITVSRSKKNRLHDLIWGIVLYCISFYQALLHCIDACFFAEYGFRKVGGKAVPRS